MVVDILYGAAIILRGRASILRDVPDNLNVQNQIFEFFFYFVVFKGKNTKKLVQLLFRGVGGQSQKSFFLTLP